jgi:hypothetical protein
MKLVCLGGEELASNCGGGAARREDTDVARLLQGVDLQRQVMGAGAVLQLLEGCVVNAGVADIQLQVESLLQGVCAFDHNIKGLDAVYGDVALGNNLGTGVVEIHTDKNVELGVQEVKPSPASAATLQPLRGPLA